MYHHHRRKISLAKIYIFSNGVTAFLVESDGSACELSLLQNTVVHLLVYRQGLKTRKHSNHINTALNGTIYTFSQNIKTQDTLKRSQSSWNAQGKKNFRMFHVRHLVFFKACWSMHWTQPICPKDHSVCKAYSYIIPLQHKQTHNFC